MDKQRRQEHLEPEGGSALLPPTPAELPFIGQPEPVPPRTPENFICLRGPCRFYWHLTTMAGEGNPAGTFEALGIPRPRQHHHVCLVNPGFETDLTDDNVFDCNRWEPLSHHEVTHRLTLRQDYERSVAAVVDEDNG